MASEHKGENLKATIVHLIFWRSPPHSAGAFAIGLFFFFAVGVQGWSALGFCSMSLALVLLFRLIFFAGSKALAEAKLIQPRPAPVIPTEWLTEEEVQPYLSSITRTINACICAAIKLSYGEDVKLCAQVIASLLSLAYACRLMGVTGLAFVTFILGFTLPKCYELKQPEVDAAYAKALAKAEELKRQSEDKVKLAMEYVRIPSAHDLARQEQEEEKKKL